MISFTRSSKFLMVFGVIVILLSIISPIVTPSFRPISNLDYREYEGVMVNCYDAIDVRIQGDNGETISAFFLDSTNGLLALEEGSLDNVTILHQVLNRTIIAERWTIPTLGWYTILVTPSDNETIHFIYLEFSQQIPNPRVLLTGSLIILASVSWALWRYRASSKRGDYENQ